MNAPRRWCFWSVLVSLTLVPRLWSEPPLLSVGNFVFLDANNNGVYDGLPDEAGMDGVEVKFHLDSNLSNNLDPGDTYLATTRTAGGGLYRFDNLNQGRYLIHIPLSNFAPGEALEGWMSSQGVHGGDNGDKGDPVDGFGVGTNGIDVQPGIMPTDDDGDANTDLTIDFGFTPELRVGNTVWVDLNHNGVREAGEPGIPGVGLQLWRDNGEGSSARETASSRARALIPVVGMSSGG